jgi:hypothetical protein
MNPRSESSNNSLLCGKSSGFFIIYILSSSRQRCFCMVISSLGKEGFLVIFKLIKRTFWIKPYPLEQLII